MSTEPSTWRMPIEGAPQERVWMAFPPAGPNTGSSPAEEDAARTAWAAVASAIARFEPVSMVINPADRRIAERYLQPEITRDYAPLDDCWMRDIGPSFVTDDAGRLGAVLWRFNGWGQQGWARWEKDSAINAFVAEQAGAVPIEAGLVNEGGGFHLDAEGTLLLTETVQQDPLRNPSLSKAAIEERMHQLLGTRRAVWLPRGLHRDNKALGTKGHVDIVASIPASKTLLLHRQDNPEHPDYQITRDLRARLEAELGEGWRIVDLPAPSRIRDDEDFVDYSYVNHLVINGAVIACAFNDPADAQAAEILASVYPGRKVVSVDATELFARGGGIHCITCQQPATAAVI